MPRKFPPEFKRDVVAVARRGDLTVNEVACSVILDVLGDVVQGARVDAYSDYRNALPEDVAAAEQTLRALGAACGPGDPGAGVDVARGQGAAWAAVRVYAPWSINVDFYGDGGRHLATFHDGAYSITASLTAEEAHQVGRGLESVAEILPLDGWRRREREAHRARRGRFWRAMRRRGT